MFALIKVGEIFFGNIFEMELFEIVNVRVFYW